MTTGATIHTTEGLVMTVTRRTRPPVIPTLETKKVLTVDGTNGVLLNSSTPSAVTTSVSNGNSIPEGDQQGEVSVGCN